VVAHPFRCPTLAKPGGELPPTPGGPPPGPFASATLVEIAVAAARAMINLTANLPISVSLLKTTYSYQRHINQVVADLVNKLSSDILHLSFKLYGLVKRSVLDFLKI
jgi:hypothetical protein